MSTLMERACNHFGLNDWEAGIQVRVNNTTAVVGWRAAMPGNRTALGLYEEPIPGASRSHVVVLTERARAALIDQLTREVDEYAGGAS